MRALQALLSCLVVGSLAALAAADELPPQWWLITDEDPFAALQQELGDVIPDALKGGPVAASASGSSSSASSSASSSSASSQAAAAPPRPPASSRPVPSSRFPARPPAREESIAMAGFGGAAGAEGDAKRPSERPSRRPRPPTRQPGGGPIIFPDTPLPGEVEVFSKNEVFGGQCVCMSATSCTGQPRAPRGSCAAGQVCCRPEHQYRAKCGRMIPEPRSAQSVRDSDAPWMAALLEKVQNGYIFVCGGSLIHKQVVLTAARCVDRFEKNKTSLTVRLGDKDILSTNERLEPVEMTVKDIVIHANYSREEKYNDLALLFLDEPAPLRPGLDTICVRRQAADSSDCSIHSYGLRQKGSTQFDLRLREADQVALPFRDCQRILRNTPRGPFFHLHPSFGCTRSDVTCDLGEDRAGSPLTCAHPQRDEHQLRGVVAWGVGCQSQQKPGVYTDVADFYDWIDGQVTGYFHFIESAFGPLNQM